LSILFPPGKFSSPYGRPTAPPQIDGTDPDGVPVCSARLRPSWDRALSVPRGWRCSHDRTVSPVAACRLAAADPFHPGIQPVPGSLANEASARVQGCSPVQPSPHLWPPRRSGRPLSFPLSFTPHGYPRRMSGRGQVLSTDPSYAFDISRTSSNVTTHHVRPHVATPPPSTASPPSSVQDSDRKADQAQRQASGETATSSIRRDYTYATSCRT
jgi:hypothetical protein